jgi:hypothetical protein
MLLLDHIVFLVDDLEKATKDFQKAGYIVSKGGKHDNKLTENALIHFENGTFLELLALQKTWKLQLLKWFLRISLRKFNFDTYRSIPDVKMRFAARALLNQSGVIDFCLLAKNGLADYEEIKNRNLPLTPAVEMKRLRPDGITLKWHIFAPHEGFLPFAMTPYQPPFKPDSANLAHPNGAKGFEKVTVHTTHFESIVEKYERLLGITPTEKTKNQALFQLERGSITILNSYGNTGSGIGFIEVSPPLHLLVNTY